MKKDVLWLLENHTRIVAFDQWRSQVESKAPSILQQLIENSATSALSQVELQSAERFLPAECYGDGDDMGVWWTLDGLYTKQGDVGLWIEVWLPRKNIDWLNPAYREGAPRVGLYAHGGKGKEGVKRGRQWMQDARNAIRPIPKGARKPSEDNEDGYFCAYERILFDEFVTHPDMIDQELTPVLADFTQHVLAGLRVAGKSIQTFIKAKSP